MPQPPELFPNPLSQDKIFDSLSNQLIKLGDMMGDGLHREPGGKWIEREYKKVLKALEPDIFKEARKRKADATDKKMDALLLDRKSACCNAPMKQGRKGSKVCYCTNCDARYRVVSKPK